MLIGAWSGVLLNFAYNRVVFGRFVPVSGMVKRKIFSAYERNNEGGTTCSEIFKKPSKFQSCEMRQSGGCQYAGSRSVRG